MKLLFLLDEIYSGESANIRLAKMLAAQLSAAGQQVRLLVNCRQQQQKDFAGFTASFFSCTADRVSYETIAEARREGRGKAGQALALAAHPAAALNLASTILCKKTFAEAPWRRAIEAACRAEAPDAVVAVACPHYTLFALARADIAAKKIGYMLDPYWSNQSMPYAVSLRREKKLYQQLDAVLVTDLMYAENQKTPLAAYRDKMHILAFPGLAEKTDGGHASDLALAGRIHCVYVGGLYPALRSPEGLFRLMEALPKEVGLTIIGGGQEGFAKGYFSQWQQRLGSRLALHGPINAEAASDVLLRADVLVNLGNTVANQLPSKVLEYLSTGKPVLNLYRIENCPSLPYFSRFPLALSLRDGDIRPQTVQQAAAFCQKAPGAALPYPAVKALYPGNTAEAVANAFYEVALKATGTV